MDRLEARLRTLSPQELTQFQTRFEAIHDGSHTLELWGAAYIVNGGCSNDGFDYFRAGLIAQGQRTFERVIAAPDTLVEVSADDRCALENSCSSRSTSMRRRPAALNEAGGGTRRS